MSEPIISPRKLRKIAKEVLRISQKSFFHKKDLLGAEEMEQWEKSMVDLNATLRDKKSSDTELREQIELVDELVSRHGQLFYHKKSWVENIEMFLVAAIVVIGIRSFFLQPFIIPTNSMFPSYYGMKPKIYKDGSDLPNLAQRSTNKLLLGADHYQIKAKTRGKLYLKGQADFSRNGQPSFRPDYTVERAFFPSGKFFVFPTNVREYVFSIGGQDHALRVSAEFDLDNVLNENAKHHKEVTQDALHQGLYKLSEKVFEKDNVALAFDVLLGDALFVDRFTYNFRKPDVGDPIVFQTGGIDEYNDHIEENGLIPDNLPWSRGRIGEDKYYIKRLVGRGGDKVQIQVSETLRQRGFSAMEDGLAGNLLLDGKPIEGCRAFRENRNAVKYFEQNPDERTAPSDYPGYRATRLLRDGTSITVPKKSFFAMGDNSPDSSDGRMWGFVPEKKVVGRALLVYYPFTKRWGLPAD